MSATHFTIYKLKDDAQWQELIDEFNDEKETDKQYYITENSEDLKHENISNYALYVRQAEGSPEWENILSPLVTDLPPIINISNSYILFIQIGTTQFAVTGGNGYQVISKDKEFNFGIDLLSRLIDRTDSVVKRAKERFLTGSILGGDYQLKGRGTLYSEIAFNNYFDEIQIELKSSIIRTKLGIQIPTKKKDYRFLAKDSVKLGKSLTLKELDQLLNRIKSLLEEEGYPINPFQLVDKNDRLNDHLNNDLITHFKCYLKNQANVTDFTIIPAYLEFDNQYIQKGEDETTQKNYETEQDIYSFLKENIEIDLDIDNNEILKSITIINLSGYIEGEEIQKNSLYDHIDFKLTRHNKTYWLKDGNWFLLENDFLEEIDSRFEEHIGPSFDKQSIVEAIQLNIWKEGSEGEYNFSHNKNQSIYVLDRILYRNIEICDLLIETKNHLYFIHVKDGLNADVRVLAEQINQGMQLISSGRNQASSILQGYYESINRKVTNPSKDESTITRSAKKMIENFSQEKFVDAISTKEITFVFACRPLKSHDYLDASTIKSTAAKLSMLNLLEEVKKYDFGFEFMSIEREI